MNREERIGLALAIAAHVGLVAWLALSPLGKAIQPPPERMTVSFVDEVAPEATSPEPLAQAAPETAPELGETPPEPAPRMVASPLPRPAPPVARPSAKPTATPKATAAPDSRTRRRPDAPAGASRVGNDFLSGIPGGEARGAAKNPPAARAGPQVAASLSQAISRQLKPHWNQPDGVDVDKLITVLAWDLNEDGSLAGAPRLVSQTGVNDSNRAQAKRHIEQAMRAVRLASPFELPAQYYSSWRRVTSYRFDWKLDQ